MPKGYVKPTSPKTGKISYKLLAAHNNLTANFWLNHDSSKCKKCQEALKKK